MQAVLNRIRALWNSGRNGKIVVGLLGFVLFCGVCGIISQIVNPQPRASTPTSVPAAAAPTAGAATAAPAEAAPTEAPTAVPPTEVPTEVPPPTEVPTVAPTPEPVILSGKGQQVTDKFTLPGPVSTMAFTHEGKRNFIVTLYTASGKQDILVNAIGAYTGTHLAAGNEPMYLEVQADGAWRVEVAPIGAAPEAATTYEGKGDQVSGLFTPSAEGPVPFTFTHTGKRNFIVMLHCAGGDDVVQNQIGPVDGSAVVNFSQGPCVWEVQADGAWSIKQK